jgi:hypothetical protein
MNKTLTRQLAPDAAVRERREVDVRTLAAYPTLRQAATILGVSVSSLSRRRGLETQPFGRERRLAPVTVMDLAAYYRRRSEYEVAGSLLDYAIKHAPAVAKDVERELDDYLQATSERDVPLRADDFLATAERHLPAELYGKVVDAYTASRNV